MKTDTAHQAWNRRWGTEEGRTEWLVPDPAVADLAEELLAGNRQATALDLGCGVGRHALLFARLGFRTSAVDLSEAGVAEVRRVAEREGLSIETHVSPMNELPFADGSFDYVLAFNVIYHGDPAIVRATVDEIRRVLKPGGIFQGTMLSKRNAGYGVGTEVAPDTFVRDMPSTDSEEYEDKMHPHFYADAAGLVSLLSGFELLYLRDGAEKRPGSWHWQFAAEKRS